MRLSAESFGALCWRRRRRDLPALRQVDIKGGKGGSFTDFVFRSGRCRCQTPLRKKDIKLDERKFATLTRRWTSDSARDFALPAAAKKHHFKPGDLVGDVYEVETLLGEGGMGSVYRARHKMLGRICALKVLDRSMISEENWKRFQIEAKSISSLNHACFVKVYDLALHKNKQPYYVMDYLVGETLDEILRSGPLDSDRALSLFLEVAEGLAFVHKLGVVHRDLKPGNIFIEELAIGKQRVKILDFGIAKLIGMDRQEQSLTSLGDVFGSPYYMSPEQCLGEPVDARSDIYSFGCTLFETISGKPPIDGASPIEIVQAHISKEAPRLTAVTGRKLPEGLESLIARCLAKDADDRYQTMTQVISHLRLIRSGEGGKIEAEAGSLGLSGGLVRSGGLGAVKSQKVMVLLTVLLVSCLGFAAFIIVHNFTMADPLDRELKLANKLPPPALDGSEAYKEAITDDITIIGAMVDVPALRKIGASESEIKAVKAYDWDVSLSNRSLYLTRLRDFLMNRKMLTSIDKDGMRTFRFSKYLCLGYVSVGGAKPVAADHVMRVPKDTPVTFYMSMWTYEEPNLLYKFDPYSLTGLEGVFLHPDAAREPLSKLYRLRDLSFFTTIMKGLPKQTKYHESPLTDKELLWIDELPSIQSLGLSGEELSSGAIARMKCLKRLKCLKLSGLKVLTTLLPALTKFANINELWICSMDFGDEDLKLLLPMKNLSTLQIRRSQLTARSLETFKEMPGLKHLIVDRPFSEEEKALFKKELPDCQFEPVLDTTYWKIYQMN